MNLLKEESGLETEKMEEFQSPCFTSHYIDFHNQRIVDKTELAHENLPGFIQDLIATMLDSERNNYKSYKVKGDTQEFISLLKRDFLENNLPFTDIFAKISKRLLDKEIKAHEKYKHLRDLVQGDLVQYFEIYDEHKIYIAVKLQHLEYYSAADYKLGAGFPKDKYVKKTCLVKTSLDNEILEILLSDTNNKISEYWWDDFLELEECNTHEKNTQDSINAIDEVLNRSIKKQSPSDYTIIRNSVISYYKNHESIAYSDMVDSLFENYVPQEPERFSMEDVTKKVRALPDKIGFDRTFDVMQEYINKRARTSYPISRYFTLKIEQPPDNFSEVISAEVSVDGKKYLKILTEDEKTFDSFVRHN